MALNPILEFQQKNKATDITPPNVSLSNPILDFSGKELDFPTQMEPTEMMKNLLGENAGNVPATVDDARKIQEENPSLWSKISKQLMKPVGVISTLAEDVGVAIGRQDLSGLKSTPGKIGGIITGTRTHSFSDLYARYGEAAGLSPTASKIIGFTTDIASDPLNFIGGGLTKAGKIISKVSALNKAGKAVKVGSKVDKELKALGLTGDVLKFSPNKVTQVQRGQRALLSLFANTRFEKTLIKGERIYEMTGKLKAAIPLTKAGNVINKVFNTKTTNEGFNVVKSHFDNLANYRKGKVMDEAIDIQKKVGKLGQEDALRVVDVVETGTKSGIKEIDDLASRLTTNFKAMKNKESALGLLQTTINDYFPHIKIKGQRKIKDRISQLFSSPKKYSTALGSSKVRKIEGTVRDINKMFGTEFFEKRPAIAYAQRAIASSKAVTSKEFFNSVKQFAIDDGIEVAAKELKGSKFAPDIARQIDDYHKSIKPEEIRVALQGLDSVQNWWKAQVLVAPSYHIRNMVGNFWNNFLAGVKDPRRYFEAGAMQKGKMINFTDDAGRQWNTASVVKAAKKSGVLNQGWYAKDIEVGLASELGANSWNPLKQNFGLFRANRKAGTVLENNARLAHFIDKLKAGHTVDDAATSVKKFLFDYNDLTSVEQNVLKRVLPFYTWTRKNIPIQLEALMKQPSKFAGVAKTQKLIESGVEKPNEKFLGDYIKNNVGIRVGTDEKGNTLYFLLGNWLPAAQAIDFLSQPWDNFVMMLSPFIKTPIELWANQSSFFKDTLGQPSKIERYPEENISWMGLTMRKKTANVLRNVRILNELDKLNPGTIFGDKDSPSVLNRIAPEANIRVPGIGTVTTSEQRGGRFTPETTQKTRILQSLFGKAVPYNPAFAKQFYFWDTDTKVRELERAIKDARRDGQKEYAKRLNKELQKFRKSRQ